MRYFHFTSWDINKIKLGTEHTTSWEFSNYWKTKLVGDWAKGLTPSHGSIEIFSRGFSCGVTHNDTFIRYKYCSELLKEYIFEEVRQKSFPEKPSRQKCMFLFDTAVDPVVYGKSIGFFEANRSLVEIDTFDGKTHSGELSLLNCDTLFHNEITEKAKQYWGKESNDSTTAEVLYVGKFKIVNIKTNWKTT